MPPTSPQLASVIRIFARQGWHCEPVPGHEVIRAGFDAYHTRVELIAQAFPDVNALSVVTETPLPLDRPHRSVLLELLARANKRLTLGGFEYDLDRQQLVFRVTNVFARADYEPEIVTGMVHCAIAEMDRLTPCAAILRATPSAHLPTLDTAALLEREDLIPQPPAASAMPRTSLASGPAPCEARPDAPTVVDNLDAGVGRRVGGPAGE
jgi:hypothetical protein